VAQPPPVREVSAVGSGDALTGAFSLALERGLPLDEALRWGAAAGAANAEQLLVCEFAAERWRTLAAGVTIEVRR
jgi:fructose-1-phosphate kinase PfkB-like protein